MSSPWIAAFLVLWVLVLVLGLLVLGMLRRVSAVLERAESLVSPIRGDLAPRGLARGTSVPDFEAEDESGSVVSSADVLHGETIILFLDADCPPCKLLVDDLSLTTWSDLEVELVAVVSDRRYADSLAAVPGLTVLLESRRAVSDAFDSNARPHAFAISAAGVVAGSDTPNSREQLRQLARQVTEGGDSRAGMRAEPIQA